MVTLPVAVGLSHYAAPIVSLVLGARWHDTIPLLEVLALYGFLRGLRSTGWPVFMALGRTRLSTMISAAELLILLPLLIMGVALWGPLGAAYAVACSSAVATLMTVAAVSLLLRTPPKSLFRSLWRPFVGVGALTLVVTNLPSSLETGVATSFLELTSSTLVAGSTYLLVVGLLWLVSGRPSGAEQYLVDLLRSAAGHVLRRPE